MEEELPITGLIEWSQQANGGLAGTWVYLRSFLPLNSLSNSPAFSLGTLVFHLLLEWWKTHFRSPTRLWKPWRQDPCLIYSCVPITKPNVLSPVCGNKRLLAIETLHKGLGSPLPGPLLGAPLANGKNGIHSVVNIYHFPELLWMKDAIPLHKGKLYLCLLLTSPIPLWGESGDENMSYPRVLLHSLTLRKPRLLSEQKRLLVFFPEDLND